MGTFWYLSPSNQGANLGVGDYGSEKEQMNLLVDAITPHLDRAGVSFHVGDADITIQQRAKESNEMKAGFHLALHSNAGGMGQARGPVAYYYSDTGKAFGENLVKALLDLGQENNRWSNLKQEKGFYELKKTNAPACLLEVDFHDTPSGAAFITSRRADIARAIAGAIIAWDGKEFVPPTPGETLQEAVKLGLFDPDTRWEAPVTMEDAALLAVRLLSCIREEVKG